MKIHVFHILVPQKYEAEDLLKKLSDGKDFSDLAKKYSQCPSAKSGGDLGIIDSQRLDSDFEEAALQLKQNQISTQPIRTRFGYHIIKRIF